MEVIFFFWDKFGKVFTMVLSEEDIAKSPEIQAAIAGGVESSDGRYQKNYLERLKENPILSKSDIIKALLKNHGML